LQAPCYGCGDRQSGCHGKCQKYIDYRHKQDKQNAAKYEAQETINGILENSQKRIARAIRKQRRS